MTYEPDTPPPFDTFRRFVWQTVVNFAWARAYWGRRMVGGVMGLIGDAISEGTTQAFYSRLPGHPHQAPDSLEQSGADRALFRFRGESIATYAQRVFESWDDYEQGGTPQQVLHVVNQWGAAGWPANWDESLVTLVESGAPTEFSFTLTIGFGCISPPWTAWALGDGHVLGELGLFLGLNGDDIPMLLYLVRKWKRSSSRGYVSIEYLPAQFLTFTV